MNIDVCLAALESSFQRSLGDEFIIFADNLSYGEDEQICIDDYLQGLEERSIAYEIAKKALQHYLI